MDIHKLKHVKFNKKYLPLFSLLFGAFVFGGVAIDQIFLSNRIEKVDQQPSIQVIKNPEEYEGEVAGDQVKPDDKFESMTPSVTKTNQITPTIKPNVKSDADEKAGDQNNNKETRTIIEERVVVVVTPTPKPISTPTPIPSSSPTPTPDLRPFEASVTRVDNKFTVVSNKIITDCRHATTSPGGAINIQSGNVANGTNSCEVTFQNIGWSYSITVKSESGETKTFSGTV